MWLVFKSSQTISKKKKQYHDILVQLDLTRSVINHKSAKGARKHQQEKKVIRVLTGQKRQRDLEIWRTEDEFIALQRSVEEM